MDCVCKYGKKRYATKAGAWDFSLLWFKRTGEFQSAYKCRFCKGFHLTHKRAQYQIPSNWIKQFNNWFGRDVL